MLHRFDHASGLRLTVLRFAFIVLRFISFAVLLFCRLETTALPFYRFDRFAVLSLRKWSCVSPFAFYGFGKPVLANSIASRVWPFWKIRFPFRGPR